ncbi:Smr/MutS family protein [Hyphomicrobium sp. CS1GBMeth3]|uniref:Smr/MutS family protein n=1 Tax=Hyphomicrobium sp. CS1GBMeth3 TaxID=1892845 RepID=UPI00092FFA07|nr:Smr/MutS family protein [Hyphomicrobium sp. CS1GBMeth3]
MSKPPHPPGRKRHLSQEDEALWEHTASTLKPLKTKKTRHHPGLAEIDAAPPFKPKSKSAAKAEPKPAERAAAAPPREPTRQNTAPDLADFDRKAARKLRQGQIEIEARIDLHGMRQHEAHAALRRFLLSCFGRGLRWVLVITGKGGPRSRDEHDFGRSERGVLRKNVPMWLAEPELRAIVVSFTTAAISHGGEGALYIQLRNPVRTRS